ncbi:SusC/RagA family TonB-linked outer membrane protein [Riemerella anatipestifer]|uniref:SusC/RagA family TonB-linked outer membrane protein n=1 Tax=Riemerella anatipestifer TaxID=34085 RepID=UPI0030C122FB
MNVKLRVLTAGAVFFIGAQSVVAQKAKKDTIKEIEEVVMVGYGKKSTKKVTSSITNVKADEVVKVSASGPDALLQGATTGLQVSPTSGAPGAAFNVRMRGFSSITSSNEPLYVVDGFPISSNESGGNTSYGGQKSSLLSQLNMNDVEDIQILKDASAAAIYGSRAANGVVLITTKQGKKGKTSFSLNSSVGFQNPIQRYETMSAGRYYQYLDDAMFNSRPALGRNYFSRTDGVWDPNSGVSVEDFYKSNFGDNYLDGVYRKNQPIYELSASASGGNANTRYYVGFSNFDQEGVIVGQAYNRKSFTVNLDQRLNDMFKLNTSVRLSNETNDRVNGDNNIYAPLTAAILEPAGQSFFNQDGSWNSSTWLFSNPRQNGELVKNISKTFGVNASLGLESKFSDKLSMDTKFNIESINFKEDRLFPVNTYQGRGSGGYAFHNAQNFNTFTAINYMTYSDKLSDQFKYTLMAGFEYFDRTVTDAQIETQNLPPGATSPIGPKRTIAEYIPYNGNRTFSYFSRLSLEVFNRLFIDATLRNDSSSKLAYNKRSETFPAFSAAYVLSDSNWFKNDIVSLLKLKAGWGKLGNQSGLRDFETQPAATGYFYGTEGALNIVRLANPNLKWEITTQSDLGIDLGFFKNRLNITYNYYHKLSTDLLLNRTLPGVNPFTVVKDNIGEMVNKGHELGINISPIRSSNFRWDSQFNITWNKNEVTRLVEFNGTSTPIDYGFITRVDVGQPLGSFYGLKAIGIYRSNDDVPQALRDQGISAGDVIYEDINGDGTINAADRQFIGNAQPDFFGNFRNTIKIKNFDISSNIIFVWGQDMYNSSLRFAGVTGNPYFGKFANQTDYWTVDNPNASLPRPLLNVNPVAFAASYNNQPSSRFIEDASYIRLRELQVGYTFTPQVLNMGKTTLRVYLAADNLWTYTKYSGPEPEVNSFGQANVATGTDFFTQGMNKVYKFGINVNF